MKNVTCPHCQSEFEVELAAGTEFTCGACQGAVVVPADLAPRVEPTAPPPRRIPRDPIRTQHTREDAQKKKSPAMALGLAGGAVAIIAIIFVISSGGGEEKGGQKTAPDRKGTPSRTSRRESRPQPTDPYSKARIEARTTGSIDSLERFGELAWKKTEEARLVGNETAEGQHRRNYKWAYAEILKRNKDHEVARSRSGFIRFDDVQLRSILEARFIPKTIRDNLDFLIEEINENRRSKRSWPKTGPFWLSARNRSGKELAALTSRIDELRTAEEAKKNDPFYARAKTAGRRLINELSKPAKVDFHTRGITGDAFISTVRKPYVLIVQRSTLNDEAQIAETLGEVLQNLQKTFYGKYGKQTGIRPVTDPVAIVVLRDSAEYAKYMKRRDTFAPVTSGGHYEPGNVRLVIYKQQPDQEKETLFHEGTHQIVDWGMKNAANYATAGMAQSLWFSEGIADYFGGHDAQYDEATLGYVYTPGLINTHRIATLQMARERKALFSIRDLLKYSRANYQRDNADPSKSLRVSIGYAQGWGMCYFLNNWKDGKYARDFGEYLKLELAGQTGEKAFRKAFGKYGLDNMETEFLEMVDFLIEANKEGRIIKGRVRNTGGTGKK